MLKQAPSRSYWFLIQPSYQDRNLSSLSRWTSYDKETGLSYSCILMTQQLLD